MMSVIDIRRRLGGCSRPLRLLTLAGIAAALTTACGASPAARSALDDQPPRLVSAFFGLDDALPPVAARICRAAVGADGMPVTFSRRVVGTGMQGANVDPKAFTITTRSGARKTPACATLEPAIGSSEDHTVLLVGDLGGEPDDPPTRVEVTGPMPLADGADGQGLAVEVTPLADGPTIVLAMGYPLAAIETDCPQSTAQVVMVVWAGGVVPGPGQSDESHLGIYTVTTATGEVAPFALGDLGDRDNYVHLCLDTEAAATGVRAAGGVLVDPRGDLNPETALDVVR